MATLVETPITLECNCEEVAGLPCSLIAMEMVNVGEAHTTLVIGTLTSSLGSVDMALSASPTIITLSPTEAWRTALVGACVTFTMDRSLFMPGEPDPEPSFVGFTLRGKYFCGGIDPDTGLPVYEYARSYFSGGGGCERCITGTTKRSEVCLTANGASGWISACRSNSCTSISTVASGNSATISRWRTTLPGPSACRAKWAALCSRGDASSRPRSGQSVSISCSRCSRFPRARASSLTSALALFRRQDSSATGVPSTAALKPPQQPDSKLGAHQDRPPLQPKHCGLPRPALSRARGRNAAGTATECRPPSVSPGTSEGPALSTSRRLT